MKRKVYEVKQSSEKDCGPACLLSIIKYYKGFVNLETIKMDANTNLTGTKALDLIKAANKYGFDATGYNLNTENLLSNSRTFPYIAQVRINKYEHYISVFGFEKNKVIIMDPAYGKKTISKDNFFNISTGIVLEFYPRNTVIFVDKENRLFDLFVEVVKKDKIIVFRIILVSILFALLSIITSFYFQIAHYAINNTLNSFKVVVLIFFVLTIYKIILFKFKNDYKIHLNKNMLSKLYEQFFNHLFSIPSKHLENKSVGEIVTRANDLANIKSVFVDIIISVTLDSLITFVAMPLLIMINTKLFIILCFMLIIYMILGFVFGKILYKKLLDNKEKETVFNVQFIENVTMLSNIKSLNKVSKSLRKIENSISNYIFSNYSIEKIYNLELYLKTYITEVGYFLINTFGLYFISISELSITTLITFNTLMGFFLEPIKNLINNIPKFYFVRASIYKLNEFMCVEEEKCGEVESLNNFNISIKNLSYSYNEFSRVLKNLSFEILEKDHVFLKGKSGGGKSTFCKLLLKNLSVKSGSILVGEVNINDLSINTIRKKIKYISQKEYLFSDTIKENILFFESVSTTKFNKICDICKIESILVNKKLRYDSFIEMDANNLSGGEKQRIILARTIINDFDILIIDEALSEVDYKTEMEIIKNLREFFKEKTIIYISHKNLEKEFKKVISIE